MGCQRLNYRTQLWRMRWSGAGGKIMISRQWLNYWSLIEALIILARWRLHSISRCKSLIKESVTKCNPSLQICSNSKSPPCPSLSRISLCSRTMTTLCHNWKKSSQVKNNNNRVVDNYKEVLGDLHVNCMFQISLSQVWQIDFLI